MGYVLDTSALVDAYTKWYSPQSDSDLLGSLGDTCSIGRRNSSRRGSLGT